MGLVNTVVPLDRLEEETVGWCREMLALSPFALRLVKASFHAHEDGYAGVQQLAHDANLLFYASDEAREGREAYKDKRAPDFSKFPRRRRRRVSSVRIWIMAARRAHAARGGGARCSSARRCRPPSATCASAASSPRCWARSSSRSAPTSPTTTPTRAAAPTPRTASGPVRVTAGGLVPPRQVLVATYVSFGLAVLCGVYLVWLAGPILLAIGAASILAGVLYTGGPRPYGYEGLGEVFVFAFFGIVAVTGSYYVQAEQVTWEAFVLAVPVGLLASAILVVNNVRDLESDRRAGKRTLAVRLGRERARTLYGLMVYGAFLTAPVPWVAGSLSAWLLLPLVLLPVAVSLVRVVRRHADGPTLNLALARTGMLQLAFCVLLSAGLLLS